ncbi:MAG: hypothetical protein ACFBSC_12195 [Microcoleaceae cyanobacterium]
MVKFANPLYYPAAVLIGGFVLVAGIRFIKLPNAVALPTAIAATFGGAAVLKSREPNPERLADQQLTQELEVLKHSGLALAAKAEELRQEANQVLSQEATNLDLLVLIQETCDRVVELPRKLETVARRLPRRESLLSVNELQQQLLEVKDKIRSSSGAAQQQLEQLAVSLERNIQLAQAGKDTRQAQVVNLHTTIQESAGTLQQLQNKLRTANLKNSQDIQELHALSDELKNYQQGVDILSR